MPKMNRILAIVTNVSEYEKVGYRTGLWLSELTHFLDVVEEAGYQTDIASPAGGYVPIDPESLLLQEAGHALGMDGKVHRRYEDRALVSGRHVTGFSWKEEELARRADAVPFNLEDELRRRGANYSKSAIPFKSYVVEDGLLITGQNPASAHGVGKAVIKRLGEPVVEDVTLTSASPAVSLP